MVIKKCLLTMLMLFILMLLNLNRDYDDIDADLCIRIMSLCLNLYLYNVFVSRLYKKEIKDKHNTAIVGKTICFCLPHSLSYSLQHCKQMYV